ncbi:MAG: Calx-beta domain-containing protein [Tepidisphaeraceae bacterium]
MNRKRKDQPRQVIEALEGRTLLSGMFGDLPTVSIADSSATESSSSGSNNYMAFSVSLDAPTFEPLSVQYQTVDGTAKAGTDYTSTAGSVNFGIGDTTQEIDVPIASNTRIGPNLTFYVQLINSFSATIGQGTATGTIIDANLPAVKVSAVQPTASAIGPVNGTVRFSRSAATNTLLKVVYATTGTAKAGVDYAKLSGSAVIAAGKTYVDVAVKPITTSSKAGTKTVIFSVKAASTYVLGSPAKATVNITNKETVPPSAKLTSNPGVAAASTAPYRFTAVYTDNAAMSLASVATGNISVTGPNGYSQLATLLSKKLSTDGKSVTAVYSIPAPGGSWDPSDDGTYTILVVANQVKDAAGNSLVAGGLGTIAVTV